MNLNLSADLIQNLIMFFVIGLICFVYNKPIATELSKVYSIPLKWLFGEKQWLQPLNRTIISGLRLALYGGVSIAVIVLLLTLGSILNF